MKMVKMILAASVLSVSAGAIANECIDQCNAQGQIYYTQCVSQPQNQNNSCSSQIGQWYAQCTAACG